MSDEDQIFQVDEHVIAWRDTGETEATPAETPTPAVGIDLGTTNSVVSFSREGKPETLRDDEGRGLLPSVVAYMADGSVKVGEDARAMLVDRPETVVGSIKRLMGRGVDDLKRLAGTLPYDVAPPENEDAMVRLLVTGRRLTPVEVSAQILRTLKWRAEERLEHRVDKAVVTVPAYFDDAARHATKDAAKLAGLEVLRLVNEPTAAALAYGLDRGAEGLYAVYDLGGGTFDISLLRMEKGVFQVRATGGDSALGGDDFDHAVAERFLAERADLVGQRPLTSSAAKTALMAARRAKEDLTRAESGEWPLSVDGEETVHGLDRAAFDALIEPMVARTIDICRGVLDDAGVAPADIQGVVLVGGSTRVPLVRRAVADFFGREPLADIDPDEVVASGAALQAEALTVGGDALLLDVTPLSLGIETMGGLTERIIPRNMPIPVAAYQEFTTYQDGQSAMAIHVVQGDREMVDQNRSLARFELRGIPPMVAGAPRIRVTFTVDADGLLTVAAREESTGAEQTVAVKPSYGIDEHELARMLYESMEYAEQDMTLRALAEARIEAQRTINAVHSAIRADGDLLTDEDRIAIDSTVGALEKAMVGDSRVAIAAVLQALDTATRPFAERRMDRGVRQVLAGTSIDDLDDGSPEDQSK